MTGNNILLAVLNAVEDRGDCLIINKAVLERVSFGCEFLEMVKRRKYLCTNCQRSVASFIYLDTYRCPCCGSPSLTIKS